MINTSFAASLRNARWLPLVAAAVTTSYLLGFYLLLGWAFAGLEMSWTVGFCVRTVPIVLMAAAFTLGMQKNPKGRSLGEVMLYCGASAFIVSMGLSGFSTFCPDRLLPVACNVAAGSNRDADATIACIDRARAAALSANRVAMDLRDPKVRLQIVSNDAGISVDRSMSMSAIGSDLAARVTGNSTFRVATISPDMASAFRRRLETEGFLLKTDAADGAAMIVALR